MKCNKLHERIKKAIEESDPGEIDIDDFMDEFEYVLNKSIVRYGRNHATTKIDGVDIDSNISELIELIWKCGIDTCNSCEDNIPCGYIWIEFSEYVDYQHFMSIVSYYCDDLDFRDKSLFWQEFIPGAWIHDVHYYEIDGEDPDKLMSPRLYLRFPDTDKELVIDQLKKWLKAHP